MFASALGARGLAHYVGSALPIGGPRRLRRITRARAWRYSQAWTTFPRQRLLGVLGSFDGDEPSDLCGGPSR